MLIVEVNGKRKKIVSKKWLIYGATGYTGRLIVAEAKRLGLTPVLAGRSEESIKQLATEFGFESRCFDLSSRQIIAEALSDIDVVLHCAGPFSETARPMIAACLHSKTHYLDITGEIEVFEHGQLLDDSAKKAGITVCPGVGFDVVPTDCLANALKQKLPDADTLWLGFSSRSGLSPGTAKTSVEGIAGGGKIRRDGRIMQVPLAYKVRNIDFGVGTEKATTIPWGDVSTAYFTTQIPNIDVYIPLPPKKIKQMQRMDKFRWVFGWRWVMSLMKGQIDKKIKGPSADKLQEQKTYVWGEAMNPSGDIVTGRIVTANGYQLTMLAAIGIVQHFLANEVTTGYQTPSLIMGADFVTTLAGSSEFTFEDSREDS